METVLIKGNDLTAEQIGKLTQFKGLLNDEKMFLECNSFYFTKDGKKISNKDSEYYPICTSLKNLPY
jgi:hypothetical protein